MEFMFSFANLMPKQHPLDNIWLAGRFQIEFVVDSETLANMVMGQAVVTEDHTYARVEE